MSDFILISAAWFLKLNVTTCDKDGNVLSDDGAYQKRGAEQVYVFAEFLQSKGLLNAGVDVSRRPDLELRFSDLTEQGQSFARSALDNWMKALDRSPKTPVDPSGLEKRWTKFTSA